ncbi:MAG TPA: polyprenyl diphosphate synthase [Methylomirabilota bacterium]|jgi:undecaprenyl diphosphate synthase|nr:polyprenyl diphosphate synthase [Methylomirabilota bacterium]
MNESTSAHRTGLHVAIIPDGNGRWATARGLARTVGHLHGTDAVRRTVEAAPGLGIGTLTFFAFSSENWKRPPGEVTALLQIFAGHLRKETPALAAQGVRLAVIGRRDRLPTTLGDAIARAESRTAGGRALDLRVAIDYSARDAIARGEVGPDVDLLVRTGGARRLSDFLLWENAFAELYFTPRGWPDFGPDDLAAAIADFRARPRAFAVTEAARDAEIA